MVIFREARIASVSVRTVMPGMADRVQDVCMPASPSISTRQRRHAPVGLRRGS